MAARFQLYDNRDLWKRYDFRQFGLAGEAYLSIDYHRLAYLTDAGRSWADNPYNLRDRVVGEQTHRVFDQPPT